MAVAGMMLRGPLLCIALTLPAPISAQVSENCDGPVCLEADQTDERVILSVRNNSDHAPVTVAVSLTLENLWTDPSPEDPVVLAPDERVDLTVLRPMIDGVWRYSYEYLWALGDHSARHDPGVTYRPPWQEGRFEVMQTCGGSYSHTGPAEQAVDFNLPLGTTVVAARGGTVIDVRDDSTRGGPSEAFQKDDNRVMVLHDDGTIAVYGHLQHAGALVTLGQQVAQGDAVGLSGNTGWSTGPHLHFEVFSATEDALSRSWPVPFRQKAGPVICPPVGTVMALD